MTTPLTTPDYWELTYAGSSNVTPLQTQGFRNFGWRKLVEKLELLTLANANVLEIGAGNSATLTYLAKKHGSHARFSGLDYSQKGCDMLTRRAELERVRIEVIHQDLFNPHPSLLNKFDVVYSIGVVEHFDDLSVALEAKKRLLSPAGQILTIIPNMAGILGTFTRRYNRRVYDLHVPHNIESFLKGHVEAGLNVQSSGYLCSTNFGVLSSCFASHTDPGWNTYVWLSRVTKALWFLEDKFGELPHSHFFSPYLFAISRRKV